MPFDQRWMFYKIQKQARKIYLQRKGEPTNNQSINLRSYFKAFCHNKFFTLDFFCFLIFHHIVGLFSFVYAHTHTHTHTHTRTNPGGNTPQDTNCTATCLLSRKLSKLDEPDMQDTAGEAGTNS